MGGRSVLAVPPGSDPRRLTRDLAAAHDAYLSTGRLHPRVRPVVAAAWTRSLHDGLDPEQALARIALSPDTVAEVAADHPLAAALPVLRRLLVTDATDAGLLVAVGDAGGRLLWVEGAPALRARAEGMHFLPGADWSEASAGPNAPGTALAVGAPVQFLGPEHLARRVVPWSCTAVPVRDRTSGAVLGVLDVTGGPEVATPQSLTLLTAVAAAMEAELQLRRLTSAGPAPAAYGLEVLGRHVGRLRLPGATGGTVLSLRHSTVLSLRHSEMLLMLAEAPDGLTAAELAVGLSEDEQAPVTVRAELSRLRAALGPVVPSSRPYRVAAGLTTDAALLRADLAAGRVADAVARYRGPVLPASRAPAVEQLRHELHVTLRTRVLAAADPDTLLAYASAAGRDDPEVWEAVRRR